ncbi:unnamed protein product [Phaedon cochleariae]|uniref:Enkurin domain-containing protein n=1 Tax=Phaedon cochleariae TaxID=80249 RepID=A0A9P0DCZ7_PHACE|nr:unnamed protein product [Phaedon cochleariae]
MSSTTLRGVFPDPKPVNRRNFIRENVKSVRQMQKLLQEAGAIKPKYSNDDKYNTVPPLARPRDTIPVRRGLSKESRFGSTKNIEKNVSKKVREPDIPQYEQKVSHRSVQTERLDDPSKVFETGVIKYPTAGLKRLNITSKSPHRFEHGDPADITENTEPEEKNFIKENKTNFKQKLPKESTTKVPAQAPPTYQRGVVPQYLKNRKDEKEEEVDEDCPPGHILLPEEERKETLRVLRQSYADRIQELNCLPVRSDTLRVKKRKIEIEEELKRIDGGIKVFQRPKVYVKINA